MGLIYHNWKIIESLKNKQSELLDKVIPYLFYIRKGTEALALQNKKIYTNEDLKEVI